MSVIVIILKKNAFSKNLPPEHGPFSDHNQLLCDNLSAELLGNAKMEIHACDDERHDQR
jgi:hypothetical protein